MEWLLISLTNDILKLLNDNKSKIIDQAIEYKQSSRLKITSKVFYNI